MKHLPFLILTVVSSLALSLPAAAQTLSVRSLVPSGNQFTVMVQDTGTAGTYQLQGSPDMTGGTWANITATFAPVSGQSGFFQATFTKPGGTRYFFRVVKSAGTSEDADGDGLADSFETSLGTNANLSDTDGDGFNDGVEFVAGTSPTNSSSFPPFAGLPVVRFAGPSLTVEEGAGVIPLSLQSTNGNFTGTVTVEVSANGNALQGTDFTVPTTVAMTNGAASLPLTLIDNLTLSPAYRVLILQVKSAAGYTIGGGFRTTVVIGDNDAYWSGVLDDGDQQRNFRLRMLRQGASSQVAFVAGSTNDGLPQNTQAGTSDQSSGLIPAGIHAAIVTSNTAAAFDITSPALPAGSQATLFGSGLTLNRVVRLRAGTGISPTAISSTAIHGTFTETVAAPGGASPHLTVNRTGRFSIIRDIPSQPVLTSLAP